MLADLPVEAKREDAPKTSSPGKSESVSAANGNTEQDPLIVVSAKGKPRRRTSSDMQKKLARVERTISQLEGKLNELNDAMTVATIDQDIDAISTLGIEFEKVQTNLDEAYAEWEQYTEASMELENA